MRPRRNLPSWCWLLAFLLFPVGPYVCLYRSGGLSLARAIAWSVLTGAIFEALVTAMIFTEGKPAIQGWVLLNFVQTMMLIGLHQYNLGNRLSLWPRSGLRAWRTMAKLACGGMVLLLTVQLVCVILPEWFQN